MKYIRRQSNEVYKILQRIPYNRNSENMEELDIKRTNEELARAIYEAIRSAHTKVHDVKILRSPIARGYDIIVEVED